VTAEEIDSIQTERTRFEKTDDAQGSREQVARFRMVIVESSRSIDCHSPPSRPFKAHADCLAIKSFTTLPPIKGCIVV